MSDVYERFGGPLAVEELVARLDQRLLLDPRLAGLFEGVDLVSLARHQHDLVTVLLGGEGDYRGRGLRAGPRRPRARRAATSRPSSSTSSAC